MNFVKYYYLFITVIVFCVLIQAENETENAQELFVATREWQTIREGQAIPKGLHVRINLETGTKEAKLLDEDETETTTEIRHTTLESAGNLKTVSALTELTDQEYTLRPDEEQRIKTHYRSYAEIKEELGDTVPKTDAEILGELIQNHKNLSKIEAASKYKMIAILEDLEYLAHQYDNALEFVRQNGFPDIIAKNLNATDPEILKQTLILLGSLVQNNAKVQIHAFEQGCIEMVLRILQQNPDDSVKSKAAFALSCLVRRFPLAQHDFVQRGGVPIISKLFDLPETKLQIKLTTLISDMLSEYEEAKKDTKNPDYVSKLQQYGLVNLSSRLESLNWCQNLNNLLFSVVIVDRYDHDAIEKVLTAIYLVTDSCSYSLKDVVSGLEEQYITLSKDETESDGYFKRLRKLCWDIIAKLNSKQNGL